MNLSPQDIAAIAEAVAAKMATPATKKAYTLQEAAAAIGVSTKTITRMVNDGRLRRLRGTAKMIIPTAEIDKLLTHGL